MGRVSRYDMMLKTRIMMTSIHLRHLIYRELEASHEQHPKAWNKLYYARMHGRLPREIRDMINTAIWDDDYGRTEEGAEVAWRAMGTTLGALHPKRISHISHVVLPEYVGAEAALENIQMWYEITARICPTRFQLDGMKIGERLKTTLCKDSFQIGLNPATVLRTLAICLDDTELILGHKHSAFKDAISRRDAFDCLLRIKKKSGLQLSFQICQDSIRLNLLPEIFDLLRPVVEVFEHAGAHVRVFTTYSPFYSNSADDEGVNIHTDIKHLVRSYDPATWKPAMIEYFDEVGWLRFVSRRIADKTFSSTKMPLSHITATIVVKIDRAMIQICTLWSVLSTFEMCSSQECHGHFVWKDGYAAITACRLCQSIVRRQQNRHKFQASHIRRSTSMRPPMKYA
jgi:hypothetical protein